MELQGPAFIAPKCLPATFLCVSCRQLQVRILASVHRELTVLLCMQNGSYKLVRPGSAASEGGAALPDASIPSNRVAWACSYHVVSLQTSRVSIVGFLVLLVSVLSGLSCIHGPCLAPGLPRHAFASFRVDICRQLPCHRCGSCMDTTRDSEGLRERRISDQLMRQPGSRTTHVHNVVQHLEPTVLVSALTCH
jgi:hypothetical protein